MKITRIHIEGFGKLIDFTAQSLGDFNLIFGLNESGKSTLQTFVKATIFGICEEEREKFKPWYSEEYSGEIEYVLDDGSKYILGRNFKNGSVILKNEKGEIIQDENFQKEHFNIDRDFFEATAYMEQAKVGLGDEKKELLKKKLESLYLEGFKDITVEETLELLTKYRNTTGNDREKIDDLDRKIRDLENMIENIDEKSRFEDSEQKDKFENLSLLIKKQNIIKRNYDELQQEVAEKEKISTYRKGPSINKTKEKYNKEDILRIIDLKQENIDILSRKNTILVFFFIICAIAIATGVYSFVMARNELFMIALGILAVSFVFLIYDGFVLYLSRKKLSKNQTCIDKFILDNELNTNIEINELLKLRDRELYSIDNYKNNEDMCEKFDENINLKFASIKLNADREIKTIDEIPKYLVELEERINLLSSDEKSESEDDIEKLYEKLRLLKERKRESTKADKVFELTIQTVKNSGKVENEDYSEQLASEVGRMMGAITSGRYSDSSNSDINISKILYDKGKHIDIGHFSTGTLEQLYVAFRLAVMSILLKKNEKIPVFMDEIFAFSDEQRIIEAIRFLKIESKKYQIFFSTCRRTEASIIKTIVGDDLNIIKLKV